jgi:DNA-binding transcriptional LysR family regulator
MRRSFPDIALRAHVDVPQDLINQVAAELVDAAIISAPQHRPGLKVDLLIEEKLVLVTTPPDGAPSASTDTFAARDFASADPCATPCSASSDPSVEIRICRYISPPLSGRIAAFQM